MSFDILKRIVGSFPNIFRICINYTKYCISDRFDCILWNIIYEILIYFGHSIKFKSDCWIPRCQIIKYFRRERIACIDGIIRSRINEDIPVKDTLTSDI